MSIALGDNLKYLGKKPNFSRDLFDTIQDMKEFSENYLPPVFIAVNKEDGSIYVYNANNTEDPTTGRWKKFTGGFEGNIYSDEDKAKVGKIGDWDDSEFPNTITNIVDALNLLLNSSVASAKFNENDDDKITLYNKLDNKVGEIDLSDLDQEFELGDLKNVVINNIKDKQLICYDITTGKWVNFTDDTLDKAKEYTDEGLAKLVINHGMIVEHKPLPTDPNLVEGDWYYWLDNGTWYQTRYLKNDRGELLDMTIQVGSISLEDYVSKTLDVDSTYAETPADTAKVPDIAWVLGMREVIYEKLAEKVNTDDIVDNLTSTDTDKPLSANQGKVLKDLISSSGVFDEETGVSVTVGGLSKGTIIKDKTDHQVLQSILFPFIATKATISGNPAYFERNTTANVTVTFGYEKGSNPTATVALYKNGTEVDTFTPTSNTQTKAYIGNSILATDVFQSKALAEDSTIQGSSSEFSIQFVDPMYYGLESAAESSWNKVIKPKENVTYNNITCNNDQPFFMYPASYGYLTSILDSSSFECIDSFTRSVIIRNGVSYVKYVLTIPATLSGFKYAFKF